MTEWLQAKLTEAAHIRTHDYLMLVKDHYIIHPKTLSELEKIMTILKDEGEEAAFNYIRKEILKK